MVSFDLFVLYIRNLEFVWGFLFPLKKQRSSNVENRLRLLIFKIVVTIIKWDRCFSFTFVHLLAVADIL